MEGVDFRVQIPEGLAMPTWDDGTGGDRRYLMKYYTQVLASLVTTNHENNSFLSGKHVSHFRPMSAYQSSTSTHRPY